MEKFIMAAGTALRISDTLKGGTTVVLLHGYLESLEIWGDFMKELAMHYRILAIDIPGMGISQVRGEVHTMEFLADVLKGVLDKQGVERCFVVGHSMGGYVAEAFAAKYASMLQGLVLFHSTPNPDTEEKRENRRREIDLPACSRLPVEVPAARPVPDSESGTQSPVPLPRTTDRSVFGISAAVRAAEYIGASPKQSISTGWMKRTS